MVDIDRWNEVNPVGTQVRFWPGWREDPPKFGATRSKAWRLGGGSAVVLVEGYSGGIALTHVEPVRAGEQDG